MPRFTLTNRSDVFESDDEAGWTDGSQVWGGNGSDTIRIEGDRNLVAGGNGEDVLVAFGDRNRLDGGNGKDDLRATSDAAIYDLNANLITLLGNVQLTQGANRLSGARIVIDLNAGRSTITGGASAPGTTGRNGRVTGTFTVPQRKN